MYAINYNPEPGLKCNYLINKVDSSSFADDGSDSLGMDCDFIHFFSSLFSLLGHFSSWDGAKQVNRSEMSTSQYRHRLRFDV